MISSVQKIGDQHILFFTFLLPSFLEFLTSYGSRHPGNPCSSDNRNLCSLPVGFLQSGGQVWHIPKKRVDIITGILHK